MEQIDFIYEQPQTVSDIHESDMQKILMQEGFILKHVYHPKAFYECLKAYEEDAEDRYNQYLEEMDKIVAARILEYEIPTDQECLVSDKDIYQVKYHFGDQKRAVSSIDQIITLPEELMTNHDLQCHLQVRMCEGAYFRKFLIYWDENDHLMFDLGDYQYPIELFKQVWFSLQRPTIFQDTWGVKVNDITSFDMCNLRDKDHCAIIVPLGETRHVYWNRRWRTARSNIFGDLIIE